MRRIAVFVIGCCFIVAGGVLAQETPARSVAKAIEAGLAPGGNLEAELDKLGEYEVTVKDAEAIVAALRQMPRADDKEGSDTFDALSTFMYHPEFGTPPFRVLQKDGTTELLRIADAALKGEDARYKDYGLEALRLLAQLQTRAGTEKVIEACNRGYEADAPYWYSIFSSFDTEHLYRSRFMAAMHAQLPQGDARIALLQAANGTLLQGALFRHPFNSAEGTKQLKAWLKDHNDGNAEVAQAVVEALDYINEPERTQLLTIALEHPDKSVQLEAAWNAAIKEKEIGVKALVRLCLDVRYSIQAQEYLEWAEKGSEIPAAAREPEFRAKAFVANQLNEYDDTQADSLEVIDTRSLRWPPERKPVEFRLVRYSTKAKTKLDDDETGIAIVEPEDANLLYPYQTAQRPPDDIYALHCATQMHALGLLADPELSSEDFQKLLHRVPEAERQKYQAIEFIVAYRYARELRFGGPTIALASAKRGEEEGWIVVEGATIHWHPQSTQPAESLPEAVLLVHAGRFLLDVKGEVDRAKYLQPKQPKDPAVIVAAYEELLQELETARESRQLELFDSESPLAVHFQAYVKALETKQHTPVTEGTIKTYERVLAVAKKMSPDNRASAFDSFGLLGTEFANYCDALAAAGRKPDVIAHLERVEPYWQYVLGYEMLAQVAIKIEELERAENWLKELREQNPDYVAGTILLADVLIRRGKPQEGEAVLVAAMRASELQFQSNDTEYGDTREYYQEQYSEQRMAFLRLFPERGEQALEELQLPAKLTVKKMPEGAIP